MSIKPKEPEQEPVAIPDWPESESLADLEYAQNTPETWEPEYRQVWQELQVAERNKAILRRYAKELRALLTTPPQRTWVGLDFDTIEDCFPDGYSTEAGTANTTKKKKK